MIFFLLHEKDKKENKMHLNKKVFLFIVFLFIIIYFIASHYFFLGYTTWDGFVYRITTIVEVMKYGHLSGDKFFSSYPELLKPFFEFIHIPFLKLFGLKGLYFSFSLTIFPLSILTIYQLVKYLTDNQVWAFFSALVFVSFPFINEQPFSGYIDFAVIGAMAFFIHQSLIAIENYEFNITKNFFFIISILLFSFSRQQAPYIAILLFSMFVIINYKLKNILIRDHYWTYLTFFAGVFPSLLVQLYNWVKFGSPIYPYQFDAFGIKSTSGYPLYLTLRGAGLQNNTLYEYIFSSIRSWILPNSYPVNFFDSRSFGAGITLYVFLFSILLFHKYSRQQKSLAISLLLTSIIIKDFWLPRYAYEVIIMICFQIGGALAYFFENQKKIPYYTLLFLVLIQLFGRPIYSYLIMQQDDAWYVRTNISESPFFPERGTTRVEVFPDNDAKIILVSAVNEFYLPLYGRNLTNDILAEGFYKLKDQTCEEINEVYFSEKEKFPEQEMIMIVDQKDLIASRCDLPCAWEGKYGCLAYQSRTR